MAIGNNYKPLGTPLLCSAAADSTSLRHAASAAATATVLEHLGRVAVVAHGLQRKANSTHINITVIDPLHSPAQPSPAKHMHKYSRYTAQHIIVTQPLHITYIHHIHTHSQ